MAVPVSERHAQVGPSYTTSLDSTATRSRFPAGCDRRGLSFSLLSRVCDYLLWPAGQGYGVCTGVPLGRILKKSGDGEDSSVTSEPPPAETLPGAVLHGGYNSFSHSRQHVPRASGYLDIEGVWLVIGGPWLARLFHQSVADQASTLSTRTGSAASGGGVAAVLGPTAGDGDPSATRNHPAL